MTALCFLVLGTWHMQHMKTVLSHSSMASMTLKLADTDTRQPEHSRTLLSDWRVAEMTRMPLTWPTRRSGARPPQSRVWHLNQRLRASPYSCCDVVICVAAVVEHDNEAWTSLLLKWLGLMQSWWLERGGANCHYHRTHVAEKAHARKTCASLPSRSMLPKAILW